MLWYKSWLETRWRFVIGLALLLMAACGGVVAYPELVKLMPTLTLPSDTSELGRRIREAAELSRSYRGYIWMNLFRQNFSQMVTLFAVLLGSGGLLAQMSGGGTLFTLSLPVTRARLLGVRAATGLLELFALALIPALTIPLLSPIIGQSYSVADALLHGISMFVAGSVFFSLAFLLSTVFADVWRPLLFALCAAFAVALIGELFRAFNPYNIFAVMNGERYFRGEGVAWLGLAVSALASSLMLWAATKNIARLDF